ncbi:hypothetical protein [Stenotrophomonas nitritireducens]|nr:hypothetical protein [Stenotrophomonas nitritireducens]
MHELDDLTCSSQNNCIAQRRLKDKHHLQLVAGHEAQSIGSVLMLPGLRNNSPQLPQLYLRYRVYGPTRQLLQHRAIGFPDAWSHS